MLSQASLGQDLNIQVYSTEEGLPQNQVSAVYRDSRGYLWVGTLSGVGRYNGRAWRTFTRLDGLNRNYITAITELHDGRIVIGMRNGGVNLIRGEKILDFHDDPFLKDCNVNDLLTDQSGRVWIAASEGVGVFDGDQFTLVREGNGRQPTDLLSLVERGDGVIWVGGRGELFRYASNMLYPFRHEGIQDKELRVLAEDLDRNLYVGTDKGLFHFDGQKLHPLPYPAADKPISCATAEADGTMWFGTDNAGVFTIKDGRSRLLNESNGLDNLVIRSIFADDQKLIWIGSDDGLNKYTPGPFLAYRTKHGLVHPLVRTFYLDENDLLWIGTRGGVNTLDKNGVISVIETRGFTSDQIYDINKTPDGRMWFATSRGATSLINGAVRNYTIADGLPGNFVRQVYVNRQGELIFAAKGLSRLVGDRMEAISDLELLVQSLIYEMAQDSEGDYWLATTRGMLVYEPDTDHVRQFEDFRDTTVWDLDIDERGRVFGATNGVGLLMYEGDQVTQLTTADGLSNDYIWSVVCASNGEIWAYNTMGLDRIGRSIVHYNIHDGLSGREGSATAAIEDRAGNLFFGTDDGLTQFIPRHDRKSTEAPKVYLEQVEVNGQAIDDEAGRTFTFDRNNMVFRFAGLSLVKERETQFATRLEGLETEWSNFSSDNHIRYFNLDPGAYLFQVKARNSRGVTSTAPADFAFTITPAVWETLWFRLSAVLLVALLIYGYIKFNMRRLENNKRELERLVSEKTEALRAANKDLLETQQQLVDTAHRAGMAQIATGVIHNVGNILNSINVTLEMMQEQAEDPSHTRFLNRILELIKEHKADLGAFLTRDERGKQVPEYMERATRLLEQNRARGLTEIEQLRKQIHCINEIIRTQQAYAKVDTFFDEVDLDALIDDCIRVEANELKDPELQFEKDMDPLPMVRVPKVKLMQVILNLLKNGAEATRLREEDGPRWIKIRGFQTGGGMLRIEVSDNGTGIDPEAKERIFTYGFTTKKDGHGFGLHFCAIAMSEMDGRIGLKSSGPGQGSTFVLELPPSRDQAAEEAKA